MNALSREARALIDDVSRLDDPTQADKLRVRARLTAELGGAALAGLALSSSAQAGAATSVRAASKGAWPLGLKLLLTGAALSLVAGALWLSGSAREPAHEARRAHVQASRVAQASGADTHSGREAERLAVPAPLQIEALAPERAGASARPEPNDEPRRSQRAAKAAEAPPAEPPTASGANSLGLELGLLGQAQAALRAGRPERALELANEHRVRFAEGVMKEERLGIEVLAACALGRDARAQAEAFLRAAGSSPLAARVRKACGIAP